MRREGRDRVTATGTLHCGLCGTQTASCERGWRAELHTSADERSIAVFCAACWDREVLDLDDG